MQQNCSCAIVDQLRQRLQLVIENADECGATEVISKLEGLTLTKDVLEITRIGLTVNDVRRRTAQIWPNLSKQCRSLIKSWQKLADIQRPISSCEGSSNGGTPNLVSPSVRRGLTPRTPGGTIGKRVTSTDSKCSNSKNGISPNNGSYAPRKVSPFTTAIQVHKSASVGGLLCSMSTEAAAAPTSSSKHSSPDSSLPVGTDAASFNAAEKRKAEQSGMGTIAKRCKTVSNFNQVSPPIPRNGSSYNLNSGITNSNNSVSVVAARKDVQSTAELVAQLTGNLPQNMTIDLSKPEIETLRSSVLYTNDSKFTKNDVSPQSGVSAATNGSTLGKTKRKYTKRAAKFFRNSMEENGNMESETNSLTTFMKEKLEKEIKIETNNLIDNFESQTGSSADHQTYLATTSSSGTTESAVPSNAAHVNCMGFGAGSSAEFYGTNANSMGGIFDYYYNDDIWSTNEIGELLCTTAKTSSKHVFLDVLLPSGFLMPIQCPTYRTLMQLKQDVFIQAKRLPPSARLDDISNYIFSTIGLDGTTIELYDEQNPVSQLHSCLPILELIEPKGNMEEKMLAQKISTVMGFPISELERNLTEETELFRLELFEVCCRTEKERGTYGSSHYAFFREPLITRLSAKSSICTEVDAREVHEDDFDFVEHPEDPNELEKLALDRLRGRLEFSGHYLEVWYAPKDRERSSNFTHSVKIKDVFDKTPEDIIASALERLRDIYSLEIDESPDDFILQIVGQRVFIISDNNEYITQFQYVRSCLVNYRIPHLMLRRKEIVFCDYVEPPLIFQPAYSRKRQQNARLKSLGQQQQRANQQQQQETRSFWDLDENLRIRIHSVSQMIVGDNDKVFLRVAVAVGAHILDIQETAMVAPNNPRFLDGGLLEFGVYLKDLPEAAQFSFSLICVRGAGRSSSRSTNISSNREPLGWTNCRIFDWRHCLLKGKHSMNLWPFPKDFQEKKTLMNLLGLPGINLNDAVARVEVEFVRYNDNFIYEFPSKTTIAKFIDILRERRSNASSDLRQRRRGKYNNESDSDDDDVSTTLLQVGSPELDQLLCLQRCLDTSKLSEEEQNFLWRMRYKIRDLFPQTLVVLADCACIWRKREKTCEFYAMLDEWPELRVETAIELLDGRYVDSRLRELAVKNLERSLNNDELRLHLLALVQAIRYEPFAASPLAIMLVSRSLKCFRIGHTVFWLLRAELAHLLTDDRNKIPSLYFRYALMLEAICRGCSVYLDSIIKQVEMISTLTWLSTQVRSQNFTTKKLQQELEAHKESLQFMDSPLSPIDHLGELIIEECRVLGSAKMPLRLAWRNCEPLAHISSATHQLIFKNGDDMRQDMLTLQVMRIMDSKWKSHNFDYCMTLYEVLPMGRNIGLIQVVQNCRTLFEIQCEARPVASSLNMDTYLLHKYLYQKCESTQYMERVERFRASLAGYCVATYVIGIRDRHQDNIMVADDGRIFHIDFGHFLGHTKRKLGINRERTEFILTEHFLCAIAHSKDYRKSHEFATFRDMCIKGFMIVHHHARFYIALFRMMLCMGLPELSSQDNVDFLKDSLMYSEMKRDRASETFQAIFDQAIRGDWSVSVNWFFHSVKHI